MNQEARDLVIALTDALLTMLNIEGAATAAAAHLGAFDGLDVQYHSDKARAALQLVKEYDPLLLEAATR